MNKTITLVLSEQETNIVMAGVSKLPWDIANQVMRTLQLQVAQAMEEKNDTEQETAKVALVKSSKT